MGLPTEINEAGSRIKTLNYDALNRVTQITSGYESLKTSYGAYGVEKLESLKAGTATSTLNFGYNPRGLVSERTSNGKTTRFEYDLAGNLTKMTTPEKLVQSYTYNQREQVETLTADGKTFTYAYYPNGLLRSTTYPSFTTGVTLSCTYSYDNAKRLTEMSYAKNGAPYLKYSYGYDQNGNIISEKVNDVLEKSYTFNNRGQLATTSFKDKGTRTYAYDSRGNRTKATGPVTELKDKTETAYSWDAWDRLSNVKQGNETLASFQYDASGIRTTKTTDQGTTTYDCDNSGRVITESTEDGIKA